MKIKLLYDQIIRNYHQKNYERTLSALNEYFSIKESGVTAEILKIYADVLNRLYKSDEALKVLEILNRNFLYFNSEVGYKHECARVNIYNSNLEQAEKLLLPCVGKTDNSRLYFDLGKALLLQGKYEKAKEIFAICINLNNDEFLTETSQKYIEKIDRKLKDGTLLEISYEYFKKDGFQLQPRHIIYAREVHNVTDDQNFNDYKKYNFPYLIWKIDNNKIYAFPVTINTKVGTYHKLHAKKYPNFPFERSIKDRLVCIDEEKIDRVIDYIHDDDFKNILSDIYISKYIAHKREFIKTKDFFLDIMMQEYDIQLYDILVFYNINKRNVNYYFIFAEDEENYKVVELNTTNEVEFSIKDLDFQYIDKKDYVFKMLRPSEKVKSEIISMLTNNYSKKKK